MNVADMTTTEMQALAERLAPHLHPLARRRQELLQEQQKLMEENAEIQQEIDAALPAAQLATAQHQATATQIQELQKRLLLEKRASQQLWTPIQELRTQRGLNNTRLQDIPLELADLDQRIASPTTLRPRP